MSLSKYRSTYFLLINFILFDHLFLELNSNFYYLNSKYFQLLELIHLNIFHLNYPNFSLFNFITFHKITTQHLFSKCYNLLKIIWNFRFYFLGLIQLQDKYL